VRAGFRSPRVTALEVLVFHLIRSGLGVSGVANAVAGRRPSTWNQNVRAAAK
jgi:hypothetical protein